MHLKTTGHDIFSAQDFILLHYFISHQIMSRKFFFSDLQYANWFLRTPALLLQNKCENVALYCGSSQIHKGIKWSAVHLPYFTFFFTKKFFGFLGKKQGSGSNKGRFFIHSSISFSVRPPRLRVIQPGQRPSQPGLRPNQPTLRPGLGIDVWDIFF